MYLATAAHQVIVCIPQYSMGYQHGYQLVKPPHAPFGFRQFQSAMLYMVPHHHHRRHSVCATPTHLSSCVCRAIIDPGRTRTGNLWFRRPTPYPLGHIAIGSKGHAVGPTCQRSHACRWLSGSPHMYHAHQMIDTDNTSCATMHLHNGGLRGGRKNP